ncbi:hypothetical protein N6H14_14880 [Paenibacillus sp. CC-CFT747]|nr:hypothetical protein N6H14_14880 [Paenibacillus sp. CC-CFT747]
MLNKIGTLKVGNCIFETYPKAFLRNFYGFYDVNITAIQREMIKIKMRYKLNSIKSCAVYYNGWMGMHDSDEKNNKIIIA